jgi:hypothetical protein
MTDAFYTSWAWLLTLVSLVALLLAWRRRDGCPRWILTFAWILAALSLLLLLSLQWGGAGPWLWWLLLILTILWILWWWLFKRHCPGVECAVSVEAIQFNHALGDLTNDALEIRHNFTLPVTVPEWTTGESLPAESPAAYAILETQGQTVTVKAQFAITPTSVTQAEVRALGGGVLGALDPQLVTFAGGVSAPAFVSFELKHHSIGNAGILREDIAWRWQYRCPSAGSWKDAATTHHRIYVILETPKASWDQAPGSTSNPWTDVLDYAYDWARGETTRDGAATAVAERVNTSLGLTYDMNGGMSRYTTPINGLNFECTQFVDYLKTGLGLGNVVNCTDCGTIATTFANVLGCDLHSAQMRQGFDLNQIQAIGQPGFGCPNWGCGFSYHEVAWKGGGGAADPLFDACLQVDGDTDPWNPPHTALLATDMPFTTMPGAPLPIPTPLAAATYRERLCTNDAGGIGSCNPSGPASGSNGGRRKVI